MLSRKLPCELCDTPVPIRNTIKEGVHKGKKVCTSCKRSHEKRVTKKPISNAKKKRKEDRSDLPEFFTQAIEDLKLAPFCQNCGGLINVSYEPVRNIAHILPKHRYKSVMTHPDNRLFLCAGKDSQNSCHEKFDSAFSIMSEMPCFQLAVENFQKFRDKVTERGKLFLIFAEQDILKK